MGTVLHCGIASTTTGTRDWTVGGNWSSGSPSCSINGEDDEIEVNVDMTMRDTGCSGGNLSMTAKTSLNVVSNSTLIIEGDMNLAREEICIYVHAGSTLQVLGDVNFSKNKVTMIIDGNFNVTDHFNVVVIALVGRHFSCFRRIRHL
ncbi:MAG: hypothetical protein GY816_08530 [Cytophagales bacterium]|nr:hypothetical protein [Cytophagales bacterium]